MYSTMNRMRYGTAPAMRTTANVQRALVQTHPTRAALTGNPYLDCRFSPFEMLPVRSGPPDGISRRSIIRDWKMAWDMTMTGPFTIRVSPILPWPVRVYCPTTGNIINNTAINDAQISAAYGADRKSVV